MDRKPYPARCNRRNEELYMSCALIAGHEGGCEWERSTAYRCQEQDCETDCELCDGHEGPHATSEVRQLEDDDGPFEFWLWTGRAHEGYRWPVLPSPRWRRPPSPNPSRAPERAVTATVQEVAAAEERGVRSERARVLNVIARMFQRYDARADELCEAEGPDAWKREAAEEIAEAIQTGLAK